MGKKGNGHSSDSLAFHQTASERWSSVLGFLEHWGRGIQPGDGVSVPEIQEAERRLGIPLPNALREWLLLSGLRSSDLRSKTQFLRLPSQLNVYEGYLEFYVENQGEVAWGIPLSALAEEDPPVYLDARNVNYGGLGWVLENNSLSEFIFHMELADTVILAEFQAWGNISPSIADEIDRLFPSLGLPPWHWPVFPTVCYGTQDLLIEIYGDVQLSLGARTHIALKDALSMLPSVQWEHMRIQEESD